MNKTYAVGDIHGESVKLVKLIDSIPLDNSDTIVFLGDYIDRGKNSKQVVDYLISFKKEFAGQVIFLRGNHEQMMLEAMEAEHMWVQNGGLDTIENYSGEKYNFILPYGHITFFNSLRWYFEQGKFFFSHAGINPYIDLDLQSRMDLVWTREFLEHDKVVYPKKIFVFGHTPAKEVRFNDNKICIDTGACYGGRLTAIRLQDNQLFQEE